jgi:protein-tyrosine phosphatase
MITWITENVAIGEYTDAVNEELLDREEIDCVLSLRFEELQVDPDWYDSMGIDFYRIPTGYFPNSEIIKIELKSAAYMLKLLSQKYKRILVHCTAGIDRAPFVVAYYLVTKDDEIESISSEDFRFWITRAYEFIKKKRPQIIEHMEWI